MLRGIATARGREVASPIGGVGAALPPNILAELAENVHSPGSEPHAGAGGNLAGHAPVYLRQTRRRRTRSAWGEAPAGGASQLQNSSTRDISAAVSVFFAHAEAVPKEERPWTSR
jgi:hypothetical protein